MPGTISETISEAPETQGLVLANPLENLERLAEPAAKITAVLGFIEEIKPLVDVIRDGLEEAYVVPAEALDLQSSHDCEQAALGLRKLAATGKEIEGLRKKLKSPVLDASRDIDDLFKRLSEKISKADGIVRRKTLDYARREAEIREAQEAEMRKQAERERKANLKKALKESAEAGASEEELEWIREEHEAPVAVVAPPPAKLDGVSKVEIWTAKVENHKVFVSACLRGAGHASPALLAPDQSALNKLAVAHKKDLRIPGVSVHAEDALRVRS